MDWYHPICLLNYLLQNPKDIQWKKDVPSSVTSIHLICSSLQGIPFHWKDKVKENLDAMINKIIIESVTVVEAIDWRHTMVVVLKMASIEPNLTVDHTGLQKFVRRPAYPVKVPREVVARCPPWMNCFTTVDSRRGYWQVPLDESSIKLTTFVTPWGCFRFNRNVMGLISAGERTLPATIWHSKCRQNR